MTDWYYAVDGVQCGPVTEEYLRRLLTEERIERDDMVWNASMPEWRPAASVPELVGGVTPLFAVAIWLASFLVVLPMGIVQKLANEVNQKAAPLADRNARIRRWNWLAVILGIPLMVLVFMPAA